MCTFWFREDSGEIEFEVEQFLKIAIGIMQLLCR